MEQVALVRLDVRFGYLAGARQCMRFTPVNEGADIALNVVNTRRRVTLDAEVFQVMLHKGEHAFRVGWVTDLFQESSTGGSATGHL